MIYYFYKIVCDDLPNFVYVGSTMSFANRKYDHKRHCNNENHKHYNYKIYTTIRANGGWDNWRMVCIHQQEVDNKRHAEQIEEDYRVELNGNLNTIRAFRSEEQKKEHKKEYREKNKDYLSEKEKEYRKKNKDKISEYNKQYGKERYEKNKNHILEQNKEYRENNKEKIKAQDKEYYKRNKEKLCEVIICECGFTYTHSHKSRHMKSQRHIKLMQNI